MQVPDFGDRFWVYQIVDLRTDSFTQPGKTYGSTQGFYLLAGPNWQDDVPAGISTVFRSSTHTAFVGPRVFQDDTADDKRPIQGVLEQVLMYPLSEYDGQLKSIDWSTLPRRHGDMGGPRETQSGRDVLRVAPSSDPAGCYCLRNCALNEVGNLRCLDERPGEFAQDLSFVEAQALLTLESDAAHDVNPLVGGCCVEGLFHSVKGTHSRVRHGFIQQCARPFDDHPDHSFKWSEVVNQIIQKAAQRLLRQTAFEPFPMPSPVHHIVTWNRVRWRQPISPFDKVTDDERLIFW